MIEGYLELSRQLLPLNKECVILPSHSLDYIGSHGIAAAVDLTESLTVSVHRIPSILSHKPYSHSVGSFID